MRTRSLFFPLLLIVGGSVWFLKATDLLPDTAAMLAMGFGVAGLLVLIMDGLNKQSVVAGPFLIYIGAGIYLYNEYILQMSHLFSAGMVWLGMLLLFSRSNMVPDKHARHLPPTQN